MPDHKTKYTLLIDRVDAGYSNQDLEAAKAIFGSLQVRFYAYACRTTIHILTLLYISQGKLS
jgi:hypothetical protein